MSSSASDSIVEIVDDGVAAMGGAAVVIGGVVDTKGVVDVLRCCCDV